MRPRMRKALRAGHITHIDSQVPRESGTAFFSAVFRLNNGFRQAFSAKALVGANVRVAEGSLVEDSLVLPDVVVGRRVTLRRTIVDKRCVLPDGFKAGVHPAADAARFHVTARGIVLVLIGLGTKILVEHTL